MASNRSKEPSGGLTASKTYDIISRRAIEGLIADGRHIIIVDQYVLKVDAWIPYHPGGGKAIEHMVGRDVTDEVNGYAEFLNPYLFLTFELINLSPDSTAQKQGG